VYPTLPQHVELLSLSLLATQALLQFTLLLRSMRRLQLAVSIAVASPLPLLMLLMLQLLLQLLCWTAAAAAVFTGVI
jgi:hypothetical protein